MLSSNEDSTAPPKMTLYPYLDAAQISELIGQLALQISRDYEGKSLLGVVTLKGATYFAADLMRKITVPMEIDFVRVQSYESKESTGKVNLIRDIDTPAKDRHILVLDEIVDTGYTIEFLLRHFQAQSPASIKVATLLSKPSRRVVEVPLDFVGKEVEDRFLVGYGLDYNEQYRNLKDIYYLQ